MGKPLLLVIGGGAAGFFCAINAAEMNPDLKVIIAEKYNKLLSKVKVSGGGRCNVTNAVEGIAAFAANYPRGEKFMKRALHHFSNKNIGDWFAERGVQLKTEADGRMFPVSNNSQTIIDCFLQQAERFGVTILQKHELMSLNKEGLKWEAMFRNEIKISADFVCIAAGGMMRGESHTFLQSLKHKILPPVPSLFTFNIPNNAITKLMGTSAANAIVKITGTKLQQQGPVLITHWGLSGPAVLKLSAFGALELQESNYRFTVSVNWTGIKNENEVRDLLLQTRNHSGAKKLINQKPVNIPGRLWEYILQTAGADGEMQWAKVPAALQNKIFSLLVHSQFSVIGKTTFKEEFVTAGGISIDEVDTNTLQSKLYPGLYFAGELLNVDGITGGFNFQHAWTSGWLVANAVTKQVLSSTTLH